MTTRIVKIDPQIKGFVNNPLIPPTYDGARITRHWIKDPESSDHTSSMHIEATVGASTVSGPITKIISDAKINSEEMKSFYISSDMPYIPDENGALFVTRLVATDPTDPNVYMLHIDPKLELISKETTKTELTTKISKNMNRHCILAYLNKGSALVPDFSLMVIPTPQNPVSLEAALTHTAPVAEITTFDSLVVRTTVSE